MQHTVIAFFDTYPQAEAARDALVAAGIASENVALRAKCEPTYATDATSAAASAPAADEGLLASIERFFESLFETSPPAHETAQYAEAVRRGAVMVCVEVATDALADIARATLEGMGPLDVEERSATWHAPADDATRAHSPLEELGLRPSVAAARQGSVRSYARDTGDTHGSAQAAPAEHVERATTEAAATAVAAGSAAGMGAVFTSGRSEQPAPAPQSTPARPSPVPDEYLQNEETYRGDEPGPTSTDR